MTPRVERRRPWKLAVQARVLLRVAYVAVIAIATLTEVGVSLGAEVQQSLQGALRPALTPMAVVDGVRNVVLFAGWGAIWVASAPAGASLPILRNAVLTGALISASVESLQLFSTFRRPSVLDFATNTIGALAGGLVVLLAIRHARARKGARSFVGIPAGLFAVPYAVAVLLEAFGSPFRQERLPVWGGPLGRLRASLSRLDSASVWSIPWFDVLLFAPAGAFCVAALVERGVSYRGSALIVLGVGTAAVVLAELARGLAGYSVEYGPMLAHAAAISLGAFLTAMTLPGLTVRLRGEQRPLALLLLYVMLVVSWSWRPFQVELGLSGIIANFAGEHLLPLRAYLDRVDLFTAFDAMLSFLLFVPIGSLLAVWPLRPDGLLRSFLPALYLAAIVEIGQVLLVDRWFDVTDVLIHAAGVALGWIVVRRAGFQPYGQVLAAAATSAPAGSRPVQR